MPSNNEPFSLPGVSRFPQRIYTGYKGEQAKKFATASRGSKATPRMSSPRKAEFRNAAYSSSSGSRSQSSKPFLRLFSIIIAAVFTIGSLAVFIKASLVSPSDTFPSASHSATYSRLQPPTPSMSAYEMLGLHPQEKYASKADFTEAEIRTAYRQAVRQFHPDKVKTRTPEQLQAADEHVRLIAQAYEELMDPYRRCLLDQVFGCWRHLERKMEEKMRQQERELREEMRARAAQMQTHDDTEDQTEDEPDEPLDLVIVKLAQVAAYETVRSILSLLKDFYGLVGGFGTYILCGASYLVGQLQSRFCTI